MKRFISLFSTVMLVFTLAACGGVKTPKESSPTAEVVNTPAAEPSPVPKTTIAIDELAEGVYTGTLSGCKYSNGNEDGTITVSTELSPAEITVTIREGQVELYCAAGGVCGGNVNGVEAPASPRYTMIASGTLTLNQSDAAVISAEGELVASGERTSIHYDTSDMTFTYWEIKALDGAYQCAVSIAMQEGVPIASITVGGTANRTATVELALK